MKQAIYCALISGVVGFVVAAYVATANQSSVPWMSPTIAYILCPPGILAGITMTDPDPSSIWLFFCPLNAVIYGAVGFTLWLFIVGDSESSEHLGRNRQIGPLVSEEIRNSLPRRVPPVV